MKPITKKTMILYCDKCMSLAFNTVLHIMVRCTSCMMISQSSSSGLAKFYKRLIIFSGGHCLFKTVTYVEMHHNNVLFKIGVDNICEIWWQGLNLGIMLRNSEHSKKSPFLFIIILNSKEIINFKNEIYFIWINACLQYTCNLFQGLCSKIRWKYNDFVGKTHLLHYCQYHTFR